MKRPALIASAGRLRCALPLETVVETMRPRPLQQVRAAPDFVLGLALVRGAAVPVIDLARLLTGEGGAVHRLVIVRSRSGRAALALSSVRGVTDLGELEGEPLPPLLGDARADAVAALARLDGELVVVLEGAQLVPDAAWEAEAR